MKQLLLVIALALCLAGSATATISYSGSLASDFNTGNSYGADGLLGGQGFWVVDSGNSQWAPALLEWDVTQNNVTLDWNYHYKLTVYKGGVSHFILETSSLFSTSAPDIYNVQTTPSSGGIYLGTYQEGGSQPGMPAPIFGIKFDAFADPGGSSLIKHADISFTSSHIPVWGDFYSKDGKAGGDVICAVWDAGLLGSNPDPSFYPASSGSVLDHILVPDTFSSHEEPPPPSAPEPVSCVLFGLSVLGGLASWRRRK